VHFLLAFVRCNTNREGELISDISEYSSKHWMSGLRSVEQLMKGMYRLSHPVRGRFDGFFTLEQAGEGMLPPYIIHVSAMALEA
jgi:hypothetical protein